MTEDAADIIQLTASPKELVERLDALLASRAALVRARSLAAWRSIGLALLGAAALAAAGWGLYVFGDDGKGGFAHELAYVACWVVWACALVPAWVLVSKLPQAFGYDAFGGYIRRVAAFLRRLAPDLHPRVPVRLRLDVRPLEAIPPYRTAVSHASGKERRWHRAERLVLGLALADGTVLAFQAGEKAKFKAGARVRGEGQLRGRVDYRGGGERPPAKVPSLGWGWRGVALHHGILFWRRSWWFRQDLPDVRALVAHLRGA